MSGSIQSSNYVPGVSGWKLDHVSGDFEINSAQIQVGTLPSDPQLIAVTAGSWSEYDLPANALERLAFIGAELEKIPAECRASAEFTTEDISFDRDGSDVRTTLTYERRETPEEAASRQARLKVAGTRATRKNGVTTVYADGLMRFRIGNLAEDEAPQPFVVADGQVFMSQAIIKDATIRKGFTANWSVKSQSGVNGLYAAGIGLGLSSQFLAAADKFAIKYPTEFERKLAGGVDAVLDALSGRIWETKLGQDLRGQIDLLGLSLADQVKAVIRKELMPGGLLHRSR